MKKHIQHKGVRLGILGLIFLTSCTSDPDSPGLEYMPDMYRSPAIEAYVDYQNTEVQSAMLPPLGTIPFHADSAEAAIFMPYKRKPMPIMSKTHGWYGYPTEEGAYENSASDMNPLLPTEENLEQGKVIYEKFCDHCHGEKGDGKGPIVERGAIQGIPAYNTVTESEGQMFYSITYGKGLMGGHASLIDKKERWQVVLYVRALQNGGSYPTGEETTDAVEATDSTMTEEMDEVVTDSLATGDNTNT